MLLNFSLMQQRRVRGQKAQEEVEQHSNLKQEEHFKEELKTTQEAKHPMLLNFSRMQQRRRGGQDK